MGMLNKYALAIKLAAFALLLIGIFALKAQNASLDGKLKMANVVNDMLVKANEQNERVIEGFSKQRTDNDAIAEAVAKRLETNRAHTEGQRQAIRNASNDPTVRDWANQPVPNSMRRIIEQPPQSR